MFKFKEHLAVLNRSPATIKSYGDHLKRFFDAIEQSDMKQVTPVVIEDYITALYDYKTKDGKPYSSSTICTKVRSIKRFFEFLQSANIIFIDPAERIKEPRRKISLPKDILTPKEVNKILDQPNLGTRKGIRERTILEVFYSTGIRLSELCGLTIYDADLTGKMLRVKGKGQKERVVPMGKHAVKFLREYIRRVRPHYTKKNRSSRYLFVNKSARPISIQTVEVMVRRCARAAKIKKKVSPHTLRHTFATLLVKNGADITAVQKMLGHSYLRTTQVYIRSLGIDIKSVHQKTHPREKDKLDKRSIKADIERVRPQHAAE